MGVIIEIGILVALIAFNGVLAMAEIALVSSRRVRLQQAAERGDQGAVTALALSGDPTRFLSTVQIGITAVAVFSGAFGGNSLADRLEKLLFDAGLNQGLSNTLGVVIVVVAITFFNLLFGELVPKRIGLRRPERIAATLARPMQLLSRAGSPLVALLSFCTNTVLRILGMGGQDESAITEEEIRLLIGQSAESGSVATAEAELLDRVFHFGDRRVHEVMVPRTEVVWLPADASVSAFYQTFAESPHSRFPVTAGSPDQVLGVVGIKDVLRGLATGAMADDSLVKLVMRSAYFVPETKLVGELFREMQANHSQMAIAVDEYGGTAGIVTLEQLLEEMVGSVGDELHPPEEEIVPVDEQTFEVDGALSIEEAREELGIDIPAGDYDTIAGYLLSLLGRIPGEGESVPVVGHRITVVEMKGPKIETLRVTKT